MDMLLLRFLFVINAIPFSAVGNSDIKSLLGTGCLSSKYQRDSMDLTHPLEEMREKMRIVNWKNGNDLREMTGILGVPRSNLQLRGGVDGKAKKLIKAFKLPLNIEKGKTNSAIRLRQMQECPKDPKVAAEGCAELWRICVNAEKQDRIGRHKNACSALINVLQVFPLLFSPKEPAKILIALFSAEPQIQPRSDARSIRFGCKSGFRTAEESFWL